MEGVSAGLQNLGRLPPPPADREQNSARGFSSFFLMPEQQTRTQQTWTEYETPRIARPARHVRSGVRIRLRPPLARPAVPAASAQLAAAQVAPLVPPAQTSYKRFRRYLTMAGLFVEMAV